MNKDLFNSALIPASTAKKAAGMFYITKCAEQRGNMEHRDTYRLHKCLKKAGDKLISTLWHREYLSSCWIIPGNIAAQIIFVWPEWETGGYKPLDKSDLAEIVESA